MPDEIPIEQLPFIGEGTSLDDQRAAISQTRDIGDLRYESISAISVPDGVAPERHQEILIHESLKKPSIEWWQRVELEARLHDLRQAQRGAGKQGRKVGWSLRDTAAELDISLGGLSQDIKLAEALLANPGLRKLDDKQTALRLVTQINKRTAAEVAAGAPVKIDYNVIYHGDASLVLEAFPDNQFDVCFTDPPWLNYKDGALTKDERTPIVFEQVYRTLKHDAFLFAIVSTPDFIEYQKILPKLGFKVQTMPLIWHKTGTMSHGLRSWEYARDYEPILLAVKGSPVLTNSAQVSAVYSSSAVHSTKLIHPNEKPVDVPMHFLAHCTYDGSMIVDPFGGSGVTGEACKKMGLRYVLIERDKKFYDQIEERLK